MKKLIIVVLLLFFCVHAQALDVLQEEAEILGAGALQDGLSAEADGRLSGLSPTKRFDFGKELLGLVQSVLEDGQILRPAVRTGAKLLALSLFTGFSALLSEGQSRKTAELAGTLGVCLLCFGDFQTLMGLAEATVSEIGEYMKLLLPTLSAAAVGSGAPASAAALYAGSTAFFGVMTNLGRTLLTPLVYTFCALSTAEAAMGEARLAGLRTFCASVVKWLLKGGTSLFTAYLSLTGLLSGAADGFAMKAAGSVISAAIPVVGSIVSGASASVLASAALLKSTMGAFGLLAVLAVGLSPFLRLGAQYLALKLVCAISGLSGPQKINQLLERMTTAVGFLLAMTGCCILMAIICTACFLKVRI